MANFECSCTFFGCLGGRLWTYGDSVDIQLDVAEKSDFALLFITHETAVNSDTEFS